MDIALLKSEILAAIAHPNRIRIIEYLRDGPKCACEIAPALRLEQSNLSRHMKQLIQTGIVYNWKDGKRVMYKVADKTIFDIVDNVSLMLKSRTAKQMEILEIDR